MTPTNCLRRPRHFVLVITLTAILVVIAYVNTEFITNSVNYWTDKHSHSNITLPYNYNISAVTHGSVIISTHSAGPLITKANDDVHNNSNKSDDVNANKSVIYDVHYKLNLSHYHQQLRKLEMEPTCLHEFKSPYIIDPVIYDNVQKAPGKRKTKIISCYNCQTWFIDSNFNTPRQSFEKCPYSECTFDKKGQRVAEADVVIFFPTPSKMPPRPLGQIWVFCTWESPVHYGFPNPYKLWADAFNWTMNYRQDSDFFFSYSKLAWRSKDTFLKDSDYRNIAEKKSKTATWIVSNCQTRSKREDYVKEMQKYIDIDIFGGCGKGRCQTQECIKQLNSTYKFYLSFENSFCKDYVTEKLFRNFQGRLHIVPVVRGGFEYEKFIPPNTFINANNFKTPKDLALHLKAVGSDMDQYSGMLREKDKLLSVQDKTFWCEMCEELHRGIKPKIIRDIKTFFTQNACWH